MMENLVDDLEVQAQRDPVVEWRFEKLCGLGFTAEQAMVLAYTRDHSGNYLWWEDVSRVLERAKKKYQGDDEAARNIVFDFLS